ncbi:MAG: AAA family ATPase [bacterium]|nr:AAA family ATPase [bacterium]
MYKLKEIIRTEILNDIVEKRLIIIQAPSGYGKTFLARQYNDSLEDIKSVYITPTPWGKTFGAFAERLIADLRRLLGNQYFLLASTDLEDRNLSTEFLTQRFLRDLLDVSEDISIIFDDFDSLDDTSQAFISNLIRYAPDNLFICVCSRGKFQYPNGSKDNVVFIDQMDLAFATEELNELFEESLSPELLKRVSVITEGWPYGVSIIYQAWKRGADIEAIIEKNRLEFSGIFENEVFERSNERERDFLMKTSLLPYFDYELCGELFSDDGYGLFGDVIDRNLFLRETEESVFVYHHLFRRYLRQKADQLLSPSEIDSFQVQSGNALITLNRHEEGFKFLMDSGDWEAVNRAVIGNLESLESLGAGQVRLNIGENVSDDLCDAYPYLSIFKTVHYFQQGSIKSISGLIQRVLAKDSLDIHVRARLLYHSIWSSMTQNDNDSIERTVELARESLNELDEPGVEQGFWRNSSRAKLFETLATYEKFIIGDDEKTTVLIENAFAELDNPKLHDYLRFKGILLDSADDNPVSEAEGLLKIYEQIPSIEEAFKDKVLGWIISKYITMEEIDKAVNLLSDFALDNTSPKSQGLSRKYQLRAELNLMRGDLIGFIGDTKEAIRFLPVGDDIHKGYLKMEVIIAEIVLNNTDGAKDYFEDNMGFHYGLAPLYKNAPVALSYLLVAIFKNDLASTRTYYKRLCENDEWERFFKSECETIWCLVKLVFAFDENETDELDDIYGRIKSTEIPKTSIAFYLRIFFFRFFTGLAKSVGAEDDAIELGDVKIVRVKMLGAFRVASGEGALNYSDFGYRKSAELLAYLIVNSNKAVNADSIIYHLWGDIPVERGKDRLRVATYRLRKDLKRIGLTGLVNRNKDNLELDPSVIFETDSDRFEELLKTAELSLTNGDKDEAIYSIKKAVGYYQGDFLFPIYSEWCSRRFHYYDMLYSRALELATSLSHELGDTPGFIEYAGLLMERSEPESEEYEEIHSRVSTLGVEITK